MLQGQASVLICHITLDDKDRHSKQPRTKSLPSHLSSPHPSLSLRKLYHLCALDLPCFLSLSNRKLFKAPCVSSAYLPSAVPMTVVLYPCLCHCVLVRWDMRKRGNLRNTFHYLCKAHGPGLSSQTWCIRTVSLHFSGASKISIGHLQVKNQLTDSLKGQ